MKLDLGCGKRKKDGFIGVDSRPFDGVDAICDLGTAKWPWLDDTVDEVYCSHMVEHLTWPQRIHFFNELHRVMKKGAKAQIITPHPLSIRFYGDPTHQAPMSEFAYYYLLASWRAENAPHVDYTCDFDATWGYGIHPMLAGRNPEFSSWAMTFYAEARQDIVATLTKR